MHREENDYKEKRGSYSLSLEDKQYIHDLWIENSIPSVDFWNGRDSVKIPHEQIPIPGSRKCNMILYFLPGEIQIKEEICSCDFCYHGNFISCEDQTTCPRGIVHILGDSSESSLEESDENDVDKFFDDGDSEDDAQSDMEENELFSHSFHAEFLKKGMQSNIFLMIMITTFLLVLIIWWSILLKKPLKTFDQELLITKL